MIKYFLKLAVRRFQLNKLIFAGSIITVSIGALCISLLFSYVNNELTMNGCGNCSVDCKLAKPEGCKKKSGRVVEVRIGRFLKKPDGLTTSARIDLLQTLTPE